MRFVVFPEQERRECRFFHPGKCRQGFLQDALQPQPSLAPDWHGGNEGPDPTGGKSQVGLQKSFKFDERFVIKHNRVEISERDAAFSQAIAQRPIWKARIMLLTGEALLLGCGDDLPVAQETGGTVVVVR